MPFGFVSAEIWQTIATFVRGKHVWDLGAGDMNRARMLHGMGATVTAVDKERMEDVHDIERWKGTFEFLLPYLGDARMEVACVFWPVNRPCGLGDLVAKADRVIYLGQNASDTGTAAGGPGFWSEVSRRRVLAAVEHEKNTLIVYGRRADDKRSLLKEEAAAYEQWFPGLIEVCEGGV